MRTAVVLTFVVTACVSDTAGRDRHTVVDSAGMTIVESLAPTWGDSTRIEAEPLVRIGREEEGPYQFASVADAKLLSDGSIVVADFGTTEVRHFDASGLHLATMGRSGEGPGEFRGVSAVFEYGADSIAAYDQRLRRLTIFDRTSGTPRTVPIENEQNLFAFGMLDDRTLLLYNPGQYRRGRPEGLQWDTTDIVAVRLGDGRARTITRLPSRERLIGPDGQDRLLVPARYAIQAAANDGFWWATGDRYEIVFYDTLGVRRRVIRRPVQPRAVDAAAIEAYRSVRYDRVRRYEGDAGVERLRRNFEDGMTAEQVPLFGTAFVDQDGRLWVGESTWPGMTGRPRRWSVFDVDGVWLGDVQAPAGLRIRDSRGGVVLGIWRDELDVQYVELHRLMIDGDGGKVGG